MKFAAASTGLIVLILIAGYYLLKERSSNLSMTSSTMNSMELRSTAFEHGGLIPSKYTCDLAQDARLEMNPRLSITNIPEGTQSFALIMEDPDVPKARIPSGVFVHWVVFDIPSNVREIGEGEAVGIEGNTSAGKPGYVGPCPPPQYEPSEHRYFFRLYALDTDLQLPDGAGADALRAAMEGHILAQAELMGKYKR